MVSALAVLTKLYNVLAASITRNMDHLLSLYSFLLLFTTVSTIRVDINSKAVEQLMKLLDQIDLDKLDDSVTYSSEIPPIPSWYSTPEECKRDCRRNPKPKTCYYRFILEYYTVNGGACKLCSQNSSPDCQCILADGFEKTILVANRQLPGPSIQVCKDDRVIIDVDNHMDGMETTIHWHGILQKGTPYSDGVPFVTQCPIHQANIFRYIWKAENEGTHFWHSHSGFQKIEGLSGSIIVRNPHDVHFKLYDVDDIVIVLHDWIHEPAMARFPGRLTFRTGQSPDNLLINGKGFFLGGTVSTPIEVIEVIPGKRHRIRIVSALATTCPIQFAIQDHVLVAIATDGEPFHPVQVDTIKLFSAERYDVIIDANKGSGSYWIQIKTVGLCVVESITQLAILKYSNSDGVPSTPAPTYAESLPEFNGKILNPADGNCDQEREDAVCISELSNTSPTECYFANNPPDVQIFLPFRFLTRNLSDVFSHFDKYLVIGGQFYLTAFIDGISYESSPAPLITLFKEGKKFEYCNGERKPQNCGANCVCTHVVRVPYNAVVEVIIVDEVGVPNLSHPFHLHGHSYCVLCEGRLNDTNDKIDLRKAIELDMNEQISRRMDDAPRKDTIAVPTNGYVVFRFLADNPGFWFFHCHFMYHMAIGMEMVFQVGNRSQIPPVPNYFPRCGNFIPEDNEKERH